jgi:hypothetical protein
MMVCARAGERCDLVAAFQEEIAGGQDRAPSDVEY